jgi:hypothetical protein
MKWALLFTGLLLLVACAGHSPQKRAQHINDLASAQGWQRLRVPTDPFILTAYVPTQRTSAPLLTIYIEGDGFAWQTPYKPSDDPTPHHPVALELALQHPKAAAYLARPCQQVAAADWGRCQPSFWTHQRYAAEVIAASNEAVSALKARFNAEQLMLVGFSGGAAVAALVAARRDDVVRLVSVAGNLDIQAWTDLHRLAPLRGSLNPADHWHQLQHISQLHFVGGRDTVITPALVSAYLHRFPPDRRPPMRVLPGLDHNCCWADQWPQLVREAFP